MQKVRPPSRPLQPDRKLIRIRGHLVPVKSENNESNENNADNITDNEISQKAMVESEPEIKSKVQTDVIAPLANVLPKTDEIEFNTYASIKTSKVFQAFSIDFLKNNKKIYRATAEKKLMPNFFNIYNCETNAVEAIVKISQHATHYEAFLPHDPIHCVCYLTFRESEDEMRHVEFITFNDKKEETHHLLEKAPTKQRNGKLTLFFGGKITVPSVMNCILLNPVSEDEIVGVRLIADNTLEIDTKAAFTPIHIVTLAVGSMYTS